MQKPFSVFWRAVLAGVMISIGATLYLSVENRYLGSFLFAIGLFSIFTGGYNLFTGKIGFAVVQPPAFLADLLIIWFGNLCGTWGAAQLLRMTRIAQKDGALLSTAQALCKTKLADSFSSLFLLAVFCGMLMFIAADCYGRVSDPVGKNLAVFLPVMVFILSGFEHCVANMFYFSIAGVWSADALLRMIIMSLGNAAGALFLSFSRKCLGDLK